METRIIKQRCQDNKCKIR